jgi:hypothetical protein
MQPFETALLPSIQDVREELPTVEQGIGSLIATLVGVLERGMRECQNGGLTPATRDRASGLIADLVPLRRHWGDFDQLARKYGLAVLRKHCALNLLALDDDYLAELIDVTLEVMTVIIRRASN